MTAIALHLSALGQELGTPMRRGVVETFTGRAPRAKKKPSEMSAQTLRRATVREDDLKSGARLRWEKKCLKRFSRGDKRAFAELYQEYAPRLYSQILLPKLGNRAAAEDVLSETFRVAYQKLPSFEVQKVSVYFWLVRIAKNKATDMFRGQGRKSRALTNFESLLSPLRDSSGPDAELLGAEEQELAKARIAAVFEKLRPRYRQAIELRFFEERSREECAEAMEVKLGTFDVVLLRALRAFRKEWEAMGSDS